VGIAAYSNGKLTSQYAPLDNAVSLTNGRGDGCHLPPREKHCMEAGFREHISKPYLLEDLLSAIRRVVAPTETPTL